MIDRLGMALTVGCAVALLSGVGMAEEKTALDYEVETLSGKKVELSEYKGKVVLMVNVASRCGATPQYAALQSLYKKHKDDGLVVIGFPCNQFGKQEPGSAEDIQEFCTKKYSVTFPMMAKIEVNGDGATPLYKHLTKVETKPKEAGPVGWNFEKFLIGKDGNVVARFGTPVKPNDPKVVKAIQEELAK